MRVHEDVLFECVMRVAAELTPTEIEARAALGVVECGALAKYLSDADEFAVLRAARMCALAVQKLDEIRKK